LDDSEEAVLFPFAVLKVLGNVDKKDKNQKPAVELS